MPKYQGVLGVLRLPLKDGSVESMLSNGLLTPKVYKIGADPVKNTRIYELRMTMSATHILTDGLHLGPMNTLANGILIEMKIDDVVYELGNMRVTEDFFSLVSGTMPVITRGSMDIMVSGIEFESVNHAAPGLVLKAGSTDEVRITIRDSLIHPQMKYFMAVLFCTRE
jgi:hypothetical protein